MEKIDRALLLVAGGQGLRMQTDLPKQFLGVGGKPILVHALQNFFTLYPTIQMVVVMHQDYLEYWEDIKGDFLSHLPAHQLQTAVGGSSRCHSVANGLAALNTQGVAAETCVAIHDAARPFTPTHCIEQAFETAQTFGTAVCALPLKYSLRQKVEAQASRALDRSQFYEVQTPQVFRYEILQAAYRLPNLESYTDDASLVEAAGYSIQLVKGDDYNLKITTPIDMELAKILAAKLYLCTDA